MASRIFPSNAPRGGTATLVGTGSLSDIFPFGPSDAGQPVVQNNTAATIYVAVFSSVSSASGATQGDQEIAAGGEFIGREQAASVAIYGAPGTHINGTVAPGIVLYAVET